jgi:hypothetical protein
VGVRRIGKVLKTFETFENWKDCIEMGVGFNCQTTKQSTYDPDIIAKYSTLYDYWVSEVYVIPPILTGLDADYIIVNLAVQKLSEENMMDLYVLGQKGGDETKSFWFMKISDLDIFDYYNPELSGYSGKFWGETL